MVEKSLKQLNEDRPQAQRAMEIFEDSELEEKHLEAIQATGISDAGKERKVQNGTGSELPRPTLWAWSERAKLSRHHETAKPSRTTSRLGF
jgi:hypothetical protein